MDILKLWGGMYKITFCNYYRKSIYTIENKLISMKLTKHISETITVDTKKAMLSDNPYVEPSLYRFYIKNTAGNYWTESDLISLSFGKFTQELCDKKNESLEIQVCKTISHEVVHRILLAEHNIKVCCAFDNEDKNGISFAEKLKEYGVW